MISAVSIAAAGYRILFIQRRDQKNVIPIKYLIRDRLCPRILLIRFAEIHGRIPQQILIEVSAGHTPIAGFIFRLHICQQQLQLFCGNGTIRGVGGKMKIVKDKLFTSRNRYAADGITAVKIQQLHHTALNRKFHPLGGGNLDSGKRQKARFGRTMGLEERIHKKRRIIVLGKDVIHAW